MQAVNQAHDEMLDLYWLAYLLTGNRDASFQAAADAAELWEDGRPFFSKWVLRWSRKIAIAKSLAAIRGDLYTSARKTETVPFRGDLRLPRGWSLSSYTNKAQLEQALLAIDIFPRCALVLSIFEGLPLEDVSTLLTEDHELVRTARAIALHQLTQRLSASRLPQRPPLPTLPGPHKNDVARAMVAQTEPAFLGIARGNASKELTMKIAESKQMRTCWYFRLRERLT